MSRGRTKVTELRERIVKLGGTPSGRTVAELLDELEALIGGEGGVTPADVELIVGRVIDSLETGQMTDDDMDDIFGGE